MGCEDEDCTTGCLQDMCDDYCGGDPTCGDACMCAIDCGEDDDCLGGCALDMCDSYCGGDSACTEGCLCSLGCDEGDEDCYNDC